MIFFLDLQLSSHPVGFYATMVDVFFGECQPKPDLSKKNRPLLSSISRSQSDKLSRTTLWEYHRTFMRFFKMPAVCLKATSFSLAGETAASPCWCDAWWQPGKPGGCYLGVPGLCFQGCGLGRRPGEGLGSSVCDWIHAMMIAGKSRRVKIPNPTSSSSVYMWTSRFRLIAIRFGVK